MSDSEPAAGENTRLSAHHTGITVRDLDRAVTFYREVLGLDLTSEFTVSGSEFATAIDVDGATGSFAHLDAGGARIELIEYEPEGEAATGESVIQPGVKHLGLAVPDLDAFYEGLSESVETLSTPQTTESGSRILFVRDPENNLIEIIES